MYVAMILHIVVVFSGTHERFLPLLLCKTQPPFLIPVSWMARGGVVEYWWPSCFVKATNFGSEIITPRDLASVDSSVNSPRRGSILWPRGKVSKVVVRQSNLVWVVLKALIDTGLVSVETTRCHVDIAVIERSELGGQWGGGDAAESLSSLKGYRTGGQQDQRLDRATTAPTPLGGLRLRLCFTPGGRTTTLDRVGTQEAHPSLGPVDPSRSPEPPGQNREGWKGDTPARECTTSASGPS